MSPPPVWSESECGGVRASRGGLDAVVWQGPPDIVNGRSDYRYHVTRAVRDLPLLFRAGSGPDVIPMAFEAGAVTIDFRDGFPTQTDARMKAGAVLENGGPLPEVEA